MRVHSVYGVDFSGAKRAGENIWIARTEPVRGATVRGALPLLRLVGLHRLADLTGTADRAPALAVLVSLVRTSDRALWGFDFPFGLPVEVLDRGCTWPGQLRLVGDWGRDDGGDAYDFGLWCLGRARRLGGPMHIRRTTDVDAKAPFDCYHYRIIYQTFHGMRDVLGPLARTRGTAVLPFQYGRLAAARRVLVESCPGSTLKRLRAPHQNYKQPAGGALTRVRLRTRHEILASLARLVVFDAAQRRVMMRNGGGDAMDAVIAAAGAWRGWRHTDHPAVRRHARYRREGYLYC